MIPGAVATLGASDRIAFLRKTYAHLGAALLAWATLTFVLLRFFTESSLKASMWAFEGRWNWLLVILAFMGVGKLAEWLAMSDHSRALQYVGLGVAVIGEAMLLQPLLWVAIIKFGGPEMLGELEGGTLTFAGPAAAMISQAAVITLAIFTGLTATVFLTKKDFTFLRGALSIATWGLLAVIIASMIFGFHLGALFSGIVILIMAGYILMQTSAIMSTFPPTHYVAAALMLFSTVATLFWYVLRLLMDLRRD